MPLRMRFFLGVRWHGSVPGQSSLAFAIVPDAAPVSNCPWPMTGTSHDQRPKLTDALVFKR